MIANDFVVILLCFAALLYLKTILLHHCIEIQIQLIQQKTAFNKGLQSSEVKVFPYNVGKLRWLGRL
jgi:hypothetical protein